MVGLGMMSVCVFWLGSLELRRYPLGITVESCILSD